MLASSLPTRLSLPDRLSEHLDDLLARDNNSILVWTDAREEGQGSHWFEVHLLSNGYRFELTLRFWVPDWLKERGLQATLPAHLLVAEFKPGEAATVHLGQQKMSDLRASRLKVARLVARLIVELWVPLEPDDVSLQDLRYHPVTLDTPYPQLPAYQQ
ncbi:MAG: hypothetical protein HY320_14790 [Armatimonadetes bacterium]|nr:hypothetical protein [Armatimonadota bacterium]